MACYDEQYCALCAAFTGRCAVFNLSLYRVRILRIFRNLVAFVFSVGRVMSGCLIATYVHLDNIEQSSR